MPAAAASLSPDPPQPAPPAGTPLSPVTLARAYAAGHSDKQIRQQQQLQAQSQSLHQPHPAGHMEMDASDGGVYMQVAEPLPAHSPTHSPATSSPTQQSAAKLDPALGLKAEPCGDARMDGQEYQSEPQSGGGNAAPILPVLDAIMTEAMHACQQSPTNGTAMATATTGNVTINAAAQSTGDESESSGDEDDDAASAGTPHCKREGRVAPSSASSGHAGPGVDSVRFNLGVHSSSNMQMQMQELAVDDALMPISIPSVVQKQQQQQQQQMLQSQNKKHVRVSCHQCKTTKDDGLLLFCTTKAEKGKRKRKCRKKYCDACLRRSYNMSISSLSPAEISAYCCPACKGTCSCAACQRKQLESLMRKEQSRASSGGASATSFPTARAAAPGGGVAGGATAATPFGFNSMFNMNSFLGSLAMAQAVPATATPATAAMAAADLSGVAVPPSAAAPNSAASMHSQAMAAIQAMRASGITLPFLQQTVAAAAAAAATGPAAATPTSGSPAAPSSASAAGATAEASPGSGASAAAATPSDPESLKSAHALMAQLLQVYTNASAAAQQAPQPSSSPSALSAASASPGGASSAASTMSATVQLSKSMARMNASGGSTADLTALASPTPSCTSAAGSGSVGGSGAEPLAHSATCPPPPVNVATASSVSGNTSILIKSYEELAALSPKSLARQQAAAAAAAATTQAEIEEKTRQLQELLARRMSQDPAFLENFNRATGANLQAPIATHMGVLGDDMPTQLGSGSMDESASIGAQQEPIHDDLHSNSPTPPSTVWTDAQFHAHQRDQQRALVQLEKQLAHRAQLTQGRNAMSVPSVPRTLAPGSRMQAHGGAPLGAAHSNGAPVARQGRPTMIGGGGGPIMAASSGGPTGKGLERIERSPATRPVKAPRASSTNPDAPGRIYKRKNGAVSPYSRPPDAAAQAARRMSPSHGLFDGHSSAPSSLQASPSIPPRSHHPGVTSFEMEDEDVLMDDELRRHMATASSSGQSFGHVQRAQQLRHARGSSDGRDSVGSSGAAPLTLSPSDPNYHRYLQKRLQQQQQQQQAQQQAQQQLQQHEQELHQSSYNQRLMQAHKILVEQNRSVRASLSQHQQAHPQPHQAQQHYPSHPGSSRQGEMGIPLVDVHRANQNYHQHYGSGSTVAAGALFSPEPGAGGQQQLLSPQASHLHNSSGLFSPPPPMPGSNDISPESQTGSMPMPLSIGLGTPLLTGMSGPMGAGIGMGLGNSGFNPLGSPSASTGPSDLGAQGQKQSHGQQQQQMQSYGTATYTPMAMPTPNPMPHQQLHMPGHLGMPGMLSPPSLQAQAGSFLFTPLAPQTPSIFINHGGLGAITAGGSSGDGGIGSGGSSGGSHQQFDWSQAQPGNVGMLNGGGSARSGASGSAKLNLLQSTSSPVGQISGSSILCMLSPTPGVHNGAGGNSSPSLAHHGNNNNFGLSAMPMSPTDGLPQLPTASP